MGENNIGIDAHSNKLPRWLIVILLIIPIVIAFFQTRILDNDFYFLYPTGKYIVKSGFPHTDVLSMNSTMKIVVQQWLSSVIFYYAYSLFGKYGVFFLIYACYSAICILTYRLTLLITKNELLSILITWLSGFFLFFHFMVSRPHIFTYIVILTEVFILEKYVQSNKKRFLTVLPILSLFLINLHAAMWPMIFVFMAPYIVPAALSYSKRFNRFACGRLIPLLVSMGISIAVGFINPYGITNMLYMTSTLGNNHISSIGEMGSTSTESTYGFLFFFLLLLMGAITFAQKKHPFSLRLFLLFTGTLIMAVLHYKGIPYFLLFGFPSFGYMVKDIRFSISNHYQQSKGKTILTVVFLASTLAFTCKQLYDFSQIVNKNDLIHYKQLDETIDILNQYNGNITLFTDFDDAQYLEFYGYHAFVDGRAELFLEKNNGEFDYFEEYYEFAVGKKYYKDFLDKYQFNFLILNKIKNQNIYILVSHDEDYELIYESDGVTLFKRTVDY